MLPALFAPTIHQTCQEKIGIIVASDTNLKCKQLMLYFIFFRRITKSRVSIVNKWRRRDWPIILVIESIPG